MKITGLIKEKYDEANEYTKNQKSRRNAIYKNIINSKLDVNAHLIEFLDNPVDKIVFIEELSKCLSCTNSDECRLAIPYYYPTIQQSENCYELEYHDCVKKRGYRNDYIDIRQCDNYFRNENRTPIVTELLKGKGGYIWGNGGHGKTFTLGYVANHLNKQGKSIYFNLSANIQKIIMDYDNKEFALEVLDKVTHCDVLLIDDFGGERWTKNSILTCWVPIIKSRIDNNLPIYFSSNYSLESIMKAIESEVDKTTANIIYDRIKMQPVYEFKDKNYRRE